MLTPTVGPLTEIGLLIVWGFGIWLVASDQITVGVLTAFLAFISRFYIRLDSMSRIVSVTQKAAAGAKRNFDILDHVLACRNRRPGAARAYWRARANAWIERLEDLPEPQRRLVSEELASREFMPEIRPGSSGFRDT